MRKETIDADADADVDEDEDEGEGWWRKRKMDVCVRDEESVGERMDEQREREAK